MRSSLKLVSILCLVGSGMASGQSNIEVKKFSHSITMGAGRTWFDFDQGNFEQYPAIEARLGWGISRQLSSHFSIKSGFTFGVRFKRSSHLKGQLYTGSGPFFFPLMKLQVNKAISWLRFHW